MRCTCFLIATFLFAASASAAEPEWIELTAVNNFDAFRPPYGEWFYASKVGLDEKNPRRLAATPGQGIAVNGPKGRTRNLVTKQQFQDVECHIEFLIAKGSNSGVKLMGRYEVQILDSFGKPKEKLTGDDCGGVYPRAEDKPRYHRIDKGTPPRVNACKRAGEWQSLDVIFRAPRFDAEGKKTADAKFVKVVLNGQVIHENVAVKYPTGAAWRLVKEAPRGPLLLQADHGPVAFRNVRIQELAAK